MTEKRIHIVCFDIPYPVSHGGFFDLYYKIVALHRQQVHIVLHCFEYGRQPQKLLDAFCEKVFYYKRRMNLSGFSFSLPFIVSSRIDSALIKNLAADNDPIILEGTHCTHLLYKNYFPQRRVIYRLHNIEHVYYRQLYITERSFFKKLYYRWESWLLKRYEKKAAPAATAVLAVSQADVEQFKQYCPQANVAYMPVFLSQVVVEGKEGSGNYCLYHGNLSVAENDEACQFLIQQIFNDLPLELKIAGRKPTDSLKALVRQHPNVQLLADPSEKEMNELIAQAHINLVVSMNATGIKLKLINALMYGRHCIGNNAAIEGTGLESCCTIADTPEEIKKAIINLQQVPFQQEQTEQRSALLHTIFNNEANAQKLIALLYSHYQ